ncbi:hypothetical protein CGCS363_v007318 [Colletotrichum siamense]|uniref:uncharacterized protein n=1 Tax=Colletotrichum siamense TaxID=690259 RepID=UPI001872E7F0|nr:uncharacterized protein CGCS363_v007318 [Colletotrichum siamense]KAF5500485.1 hypothetical protein CGCS363_v007318 [Colletotrichum siamense]
MKTHTSVLSLLAATVYLTDVAYACVGDSHLHMRNVGSSSSLGKRAETDYIGCVTPGPVICELIGTCPYPNASAGPWDSSANVRQMQVTDDAYNSLDFSRFNHREDTIVYMPGGREFNMVQHVQDLQNTYASFPNVAVTNHPYKVAFGEGNWTITMTDVTGTNTGPIQAPDGWRGPTGRHVNYEFMTAAYWQEGRIVIEHLWMDLVTMERQMGFFPSPITTDGTQSLTLSPYTIPLAVNPFVNTSETNKASHRKFETALNDGQFNSDSLMLSPNVTIFTSREDTPNGLNSDQFFALVSQLQKSFSNVHLSPQGIFGSGDWTASVARLSGNLTNALAVPEYISPTPIDATNKGFDSWFYTIARWQDGKITHLKFMADVLGILSQVQ